MLNRQVHQVMPQVSSEGVRLTDTDCIEGIIDTMSDPLVLVDENGRLLDANPAFFQMVGEEYSVLSERELNTLFVDSKGVCEGERAVVGKTGEVIPVLASVVPVERRRVTCSLLLLKDLREQKKVEALKQEVSHLAGVVEIGAHILHNFGNAITGLRFYFQELKEAEGRLDQLSTVLADEEEKRRRGEESKLSPGRLRAVIDDFNETYFLQLLGDTSGLVHQMAEVISVQHSLAQGRSSYGCSRFFVGEMVDNAVTILKTRLDHSNVELIVELEEAEGEGPIEANLPKSPFQQMMVNLIKNAAESIDQRYQQQARLEGREVASRQCNWIKIEAAVEQRAMQHPDEVAKVLRLIVEDNGVPVPPPGSSENIALFSEEHPLSVDGRVTRGMHAAAGMVVSVHGTIHAEPRDAGDGARFLAYLPLDGESATG